MTDVEQNGEDGTARSVSVERIVLALGGEMYPHQAAHLAWLIEQDEQAMQAERQRGVRQ